MSTIYGWRWLLSFLIVLAVMTLIGWKINGRPLGILVDSRNRMSLSRLQIALWTLLILSAFLAAAWIKRSVNIYLPPELWALMGISTASAAGSVIVKGTKAAKTPTTPPASGTNHGLLMLSEEPSLEHMFQGEEVSNSTYVDIGKVQMFFFTLVVWLAYGYTLLNADLSKGPQLPGGETYELYFPALSQSIVTLLGISHAGYLTIKASPNTPVSP